MKYRLFISLLISMTIHGLIALLIIFLLRIYKDDQLANHSFSSKEGTTLSLEMVMAMRSIEIKKEDISTEITDEAPTPDVPIIPKIEDKPKEKVPDPLVKKTPEKRASSQSRAPKARENVRSNDQNVDGNNRAHSVSSSLASTTSVVVTGNHGQSFEEYRSKLRIEIEKHKRYSQRAMRMRQQGVVIVQFRLQDDGTIVDEKVIKSSGFTELDRLALSAVQQAKPVGKRPQGMPNRIDIPINFVIR